MKQLSHALVEQKEKQTTETTDIKCLFKQVNENSDKKSDQRRRRRRKPSKRETNPFAMRMQRN